MISRELLEAAADKDLLQKNQVEPLLKFISEQAPVGLKTGSEGRAEPFRFVRGFGDVFIALGVVMLAVAVNQLSLPTLYQLIPLTGFVILAEWLVRIRRLALPGIAILLAILYFVNQIIVFDYTNATMAGLSALSITSLLFYWRYKMPFSLLPLAATLVAMAVVQIGLDITQYPILLTGLGLLVFLLAMSFDVRDTTRQSYLSDCAFWLHLLASPLIVHGLMVSVLFSDQAWLQTLGKEAVIVLFFLLFLLVALLLDRRAMLISTQIYMIYALTEILKGQLDNAQDVIIYILMLLGISIILFGTYWYKLRWLIYGSLAGGRISRYFPGFDQVA